MEILDYGRSFIGSVGPENAVRFWVESRTRIIDERTGVEEDYIQCGSCKSENTFSEKDLFHKDNYDFLPVFGPEYTAIFRRKAYLTDTYVQYRLSKESWGGQIDRTKPARPAHRLDTTAAIRQATHAGLPLVAQTEIRDTTAGLRAVMEYPVKTMNINDEHDLYQVDTGPVVLPDLARRPARLVECLSLAFVAFNIADCANFVIESPTPIMADGRETCRVYHYSKLVSLPAENRLYCVGDPS